MNQIVRYSSQISCSYSYQELEGLMDATPHRCVATFVVSQNPCIACFGILAQTCSEAFLSELMDRFATCGYQFLDYSLTITLPCSTITRQYALWYHLHSTYRYTLSPLSALSLQVGTTNTHFLSLKLKRSILSTKAQGPGCGNQRSNEVGAGLYTTT